MYKCIDDYVLIKGECKHYKNITNCKTTKDNKCKTCTFWHKPDESGTECKSHAVLWVLFLGILLIIIIFIIFIIIVYFIIKKIFKHKQDKEEEETKNYILIEILHRCSI